VQQVLYTSGQDKDWPDLLDHSTGQFVYYGDNKTPGHELHDTRRSGNRILRRVFELLHASPARRDLIPPFFVFTKFPTENSARSVQFKGLAVPGFPGLPATEDLLAVWKKSNGQRFQNYRSVFTILDVSVIERPWISSLADGASSTAEAPTVWKEWIHYGRYRPLVSEPTFQMQDQRVVIDQITRNVVDGGRDAIGRYRLGLIDDPVQVEFALEAKCYAPALKGSRPNTVGVKEVSRLISRIRHRQFGVLVTTSAIARQAYMEVRQDRHPIIFIAGKDIVEILITSGYNTRDILQNFLKTEFPRAAGNTESMEGR